MDRILELSLEDLEELRAGRIPPNTVKNTKYAVELYSTWRKAHIARGNFYAPLDCGVPSVLDKVLPKFIAEVRTKLKKGLPYKSDTLRTIYMSINRSLMAQDATMNVCVERAERARYISAITLHRTFVFPVL